MTPSTSANCLNCDALLNGPFCHACGQKASTRRLRLGEILKEGVNQLSSLDTQVARTASGLTRNPGRVCREYVAGKRIHYVAPLRYCLIIVAVMLLVNALSGFDPSVTAPKEGLSDAQRQVQDIAFAFIARHLDLVIFLVLPVLVVAFRLLFWSAPYNLAEVSVFVLYTMAQVFLLGLLLTPLRPLILSWLLPIKLGLLMVYLSWSAKVFFGTSVIVAILKSLVATGLYLILLGITVVLLVLPQILPILRDLVREGG
jgi:hypothetical protein